MSNSLRVRCTGWPRLVTLALDRIEANLADLDGCVLGAGGSADAANRRADAGDQLARAEGLGDIVVGAQFERLHLILFLIAHRQHQDRQPGSEGANAAQRFNAADAGHIHIEQDASKTPPRSICSASSPREASIT